MIDWKKLIFRTWVMLWVTLLILVVAKVGFNVWYPITVENEKFLAFCDFIERHMWLDITIKLIFYICSMNLWYLIATFQKKYRKKLELILVNISLVFLFGLKFHNSILGSILEMLILIVVPIILNLIYLKSKRKWVRIAFPIITYVSLNLWQIIMRFIRNIVHINYEELPLFMTYCLQIDYYIFLIITWIGVCIMGLFSGGWFWGKSKTELLALKEKELKKEKPDKKLIEMIDEKIEKLENDKTGA